MKHVLVLGNQLFAPESSCIEMGDSVFMAEDYGLCTHFRYHKHKLIFFLAAMRHYRDELRQALGAKVHYAELDAQSYQQSFEEKLSQYVAEHSVDELHTYQIEDKFFEERIMKWAKQACVRLELHESPMFLISRERFKKYADSVKKPFMKSFYEQLRREQNVLMSPEGKPLGGKYSFDAENRKKLPKTIAIPEVSLESASPHIEDVKVLVEKLFAEHPGRVDEFWVPVTRTGARLWTQKFIEERFYAFGDFEDAISQKTPFLFHSGVSPLLNIGLITPQELLELLAPCEEIPLNSREGLVRQVLGWREFIRGIYQEHSVVQETTNFWQHHRTLRSCWYTAKTGMPPLDDAIQKAVRYGYNHHIERLMIISNVMLLCNVDPKEVHRWFMEMYVDSSDWVMGPNVYGMGQFSDGGIFATKPYLCGSNYIRKMSSDYAVGEWCDELDGLYWRFIDENRSFFAKNPRLSAMVGNLDRMDSERKERIFRAGLAFRERVSESP
jgi:deoxyribodipyrimidine photolyase-related protein